LKADDRNEWMAELLPVRKLADKRLARHRLPAVYTFPAFGKSGA
jgi:hypothetical protein